jgi:hypothetical protein
MHQPLSREQGGRWTVQRGGRLGGGGGVGTAEGNEDRSGGRVKKEEGLRGRV